MSVISDAAQCLDTMSRIVSAGVTTTPEHVDVLIVGAGLSGIGAACQLREHLPDQERRDPRGARGQRRHVGPVQLPRHPLRLRHVHLRLSAGGPGPATSALADGPAILDYLRTVAEEYGVDELIRYRHKVTRRELGLRRPRCGPSRSTTQATPITLTAGFLWGCSGYYDYDQPLRPGVPRRRELRGHGSCTRSTGPRTSTTRASGSW